MTRLVGVDLRPAQNGSVSELDPAVPAPGRRGSASARMTGGNELVMPPAVREAIDLELAMLTSTFRLDPIQLDALLDPDFQEIGASGRWWDRASTISAVTSTASAQPYVVESGEMTGVLMAANIVLLTYVTHHGARRVRRSSIWRRTDGVWRLLFHQGTMSAP